MAASRAGQWPEAAQFNEAVQNLHSSMSDPELLAGEPECSPLGVPMPYSGNFADVYKVRCPGTGNTWAVKFFKREVRDLRERYRAISDHLSASNLPFMVDFRYIDDGVRIGGTWYPILKMQWIDGLSLNQFVAQSLSELAVLDQLMELWVKLAARLHRARIAHADLQHGNVVLVPAAHGGRLLVRLIDYDGMYVPALADRGSSELGHVNFQHPYRARTKAFCPELDRFSHLAICCALKCLSATDLRLWNRFNTGENLLFTARDFAEPHKSAIFRELWGLRDAKARTLVGHLVLATQVPIEQTPLLDDLIQGGDVRPLTTDELRAVDAVLEDDFGISLPPTTQGSTATNGGSRLVPPADSDGGANRDQLWQELPPEVGPIPPSQVEVRTVSEGRCLICGCVNETARKFCRSCAASLRCACLQCGSQSPVWEDICGECGARQSELLAITGRQFHDCVARASALAEGDRFLEAMEQLGSCRLEEHPALNALKATQQQLMAQWQTSGQQMMDQRRAEQRDQACFETAQRQIDTGLASGDFEAAKTELAALCDAAKEFASPRHRDEVLVWVDHRRLDFETRLNQQQEQDQLLLERMQELQAQGTVDEILQQLRGSPATQRVPQLRAVLEAAELAKAIAAQQRQDDQVHAEASRLFDAGRLEELLLLLADHPAARRDSRLEKLHFNARRRLDWVSSARAAIQSALRGHAYGGLKQQLDDLRSNSTLQDGELIALLQLASWEQLDPALRSAMEGYRGSPVLDFQPGDANPEFLRTRLQRRLDADTLWASACQSPGASDLKTLEKILLLDPFHAPARQRLTPLYESQGWRVCRFLGHSQAIVSVSFSPDGRQVISRDADGVVKTWSLESQSEIKSGSKPVIGDANTVVSARGDYALSGLGTAVIQVLDVRTSEVIGQLIGHQGPVRSLTFSPDGRQVISSGDDRTIRVWDIGGCQQVGRFQDVRLHPALAILSPDGSLVIASGPGAIRVWRLSSGTQMLAFNHTSPAVYHPMMFPNSPIMCWLDSQGQIGLVHMSEPSNISWLGQQQLTFCLSGVGNLIVTGTLDNLVQVFNAATRSPVAVFRGHRYCVNCVTISADGNRIASASDDETVRLWDLAARREVRSFTGHLTSLWGKLAAKSGEVTAVSFSPDGRYLASGGKDRTVQIWYAGS